MSELMREVMRIHDRISREVDRLIESAFEEFGIEERIRELRSKAPKEVHGFYRRLRVEVVNGKKKFEYEERYY